MISVPLRLLIGHLIGDYLLQPREMAENKGSKGGIWWSLLHGAIYTLCVVTMLWDFSPLAFLAVFLSHWPLDRFGVAGWWCRHILDRNPSDASSWVGHRNIRVGFACLHYAVVDNSMHLILLVVAWHFGLIH